MKRKRRDTEVFSLSFLDVICCGFGAMILLLVLTDIGQPLVIERSRSDLEMQLKKLQEELFVIRGDSEKLERELRGRVDVLQKERLNLARAAGEISSLRGQYDTSRQEAAVSNIVENELLSAFQDLQAENPRLIQMSQVRRKIKADAIGGIPMDSDYVIFVIDTSDSMQEVHWDTVINVMQEILRVYRDLKGVQVLDDQGKELFPKDKAKWLEDSAVTRKKIIAEMRRWKSFSDSNPADGIQEAIKNYYDEDKKISLYVLADDFNGESIQKIVDAVDLVNRPNDAGRRRVRIHGIGFPHSRAMTTESMRRFPALMRALAERNDGTFIGLSNVPTCEIPVVINGELTCVGGN